MNHSTQLPRSTTIAKICAAKVAEMVRKRRARAPEFLEVDRDALRELGAPAAVVRAAIQYGQKHDKALTGVEIAAWIHRDPSNVSRAKKGIPLPLPPYPTDDRRGKRSWLKFDLRIARKYGFWPALLLAQLQTWPKKRFWGRHWLIGAWEFAELLGCCAKTARKALRAVAEDFLDVVRRPGLPAAVRLLGPREKPLGDPAPLLNPPPPPPASTEQQRGASSGALDPRLRELLERLTAKLD